MTSMAPSGPARNTDRPRVARGWLLVLLVCLACATAQARQSDRSQDIHIDGVTLDARYQANGVSHIRNAVITQGSLKASGDLATIYLDGQMAIKRIVLTGHAHIQQVDDKGNLMTGQADSIDYDMPTGVATLTGHARVQQAGRGSASGSTLVYNTKTSTMSARGSSDNRVHMIFKAQQAPAAAASAPKTPAKGN